VPRRHGDVAEQAEAHRPGPLGVMARRSQDGEAGPLSAREQRLGERAGPAGRVQRGLPRALGRRRVEVEGAGAGARLADGLHVLGRMDRQQLVLPHRWRLAPLEAEPVAPLELGPDGVQAVDALRVAEARLVQQRGRMAQEQGHARRYRTCARWLTPRHCASTSPSSAPGRPACMRR
jgi:hypothetical protein